MLIRLLLLSLVLIVLGQTPLIGPVREVSTRLTNPLQYGVYRFSQNLHRELDFIVNLRRLRTENLKLTERVLELEAQLAAQKEREREESVRQEQTIPQLILAEIIGRSARGGEAILVVNRGLNSEVREGAAVVFKDFLLGEIFAVEPERAKVRLLTDSRFSAAAVDEDSLDRARGLVSGQYGTTVILQKVLPTESLAVGDTIITSGEDGKFSKGLILGRVKRILGEEAEVFKGAELELLLDFDSLEEVFVTR